MALDQGGDSQQYPTPRFQLTTTPSCPTPLVVKSPYIHTRTKAGLQYLHCNKKVRRETKADNRICVGGNTSPGGV